MTSSETRISIAAEILLKYFPNGLTLDDARQFNKFRDYFTDALGVEADCLFTSKVREILEQAGERVGDLLLPQRKKLGDVPSSDVKNDADCAGLIGRILMRFFAEDGFRLNSTDDCKKLRTLAGDDLNSWTDQQINAFVYKRVAPFEGVCYPVGQKTIDRIKTTFEEIFQSGCKIVYYAAFFDKNEYWLVPKGIFAPRFLKDRMSRFFPKLTYRERYFEETPSELSDSKKIKAEILRVWNPNDEPSITVRELVVRTFTPALELEDALKSFEEFKKIGENWTLARQNDVKDELEADVDDLLVDPFDYLPLSIAAQEDEEERKRLQAEDVLSVDDDVEETQTEKVDDDPNIRTFRLDCSVPRSALLRARPIACFYREEKIAGDCCWSELYAAVLTRLLIEYPQQMRNMLNQSLFAGVRPDFADKNGSANFVRAMRIGRNFYVEANHSSFDIVKRIKSTLKLCGASLDDLEIRYRRIETRKNKLGSNVKKRQDDVKNLNSQERSSFLSAPDVFRLKYPLSRTTFVYIKPIACYYQEEEIAKDCNWSELYVAFVSKLHNEFPQKMKSRINQSLGPWNKPDFADKKRSARFLQPVKIADDFYIETHSSAYHIAQRIKLALELCGGKVDDLEIWYRKKKSIKSKQALEIDSEPFDEPDSEKKPTDDDFFSNAPELCSYQMEKNDDDLEWL